MRKFFRRRFQSSASASSTPTLNVTTNPNSQKSTRPDLKHQRAQQQPLTTHPDEARHHQLYLAFYARPKHPDSYHVALHLQVWPCESTSISTTPPSILQSRGQQNGGAIKYHAKNILKRISVHQSISGNDNDDAAARESNVSTATKDEVIEIWVYERKQLTAPGANDMWLLARVCVGYIPCEYIHDSATPAWKGKPDVVNDVLRDRGERSNDVGSFDALMQSIPITEIPANDPEFNCVEWVRRPLDAIRCNRWLVGATQSGGDSTAVAVIEKNEIANAADSDSTDWTWRQVLVAGEQWVKQLRDEKRAGVVDEEGRVPEIDLEQLLSLNARNHGCMA